MGKQLLKYKKLEKCVDIHDDSIKCYLLWIMQLMDLETRVFFVYTATTVGIIKGDSKITPGLKLIKFIHVKQNKTYHSLQKRLRIKYEK